MVSYIYNATVTDIIDGDTIKADVDLGFDTWRKDQPFRLLGLNAREHNEPGGQDAIAHLTQLMPVGTRITVNSVKPDKYAPRYDAYITLPDGSDLSTLLIQDQWAAAWNGKGSKPVPPWPRTVQ